jgi:hypothetical protein
MHTWKLYKWKILSMQTWKRQMCTSTNSQLIISINRSFHRCIFLFHRRKTFSSSQNFLYIVQIQFQTFSYPLVFHSIINSPFFSSALFSLFIIAILYLEIVKTLRLIRRRREILKKILGGEIFLLIMLARNDIHFSYAFFLHATLLHIALHSKLLAFSTFFHVKCFDSLQLGHKFQL